MKIKIINLLIKFILPFTDYDKLKEENKKLKSDLNTLIEKPYSVEAYIIIKSHNLRKQIDKMVWFGDVEDFNKFNGLFKTSETTI